MRKGAYEGNFQNYQSTFNYGSQEGLEAIHKMKNCKNTNR